MYKGGIRENKRRGMRMVEGWRGERVGGVGSQKGEGKRSATTRFGLFFPKDKTTLQLTQGVILVRAPAPLFLEGGLWPSNRHTHTSTVSTEWRVGMYVWGDGRCACECVCVPVCYV